MKHTLGSLFDGSGGFPLAGALNGIEPVWASEIEPYPIAVTRNRFPDMKHLGSVTDIDGGKIEPVDIITFGSPCFPDGTLVLTDKGYIEIEKVEVGMRVLTHEGRWRRVTAVGSHFAETVVLRGNHYGLECTPNHPIYAVDCATDYSVRVNGKRSARIRLPDTKQWVPAENMLGKRWAVPNSVEPLPIDDFAYTSPRQKMPPEVNDGLAYFIGRWLGDGWVRCGQRPDRPEGQCFHEICLCDSLDKEQELVDIVSKITDHYHVEHCRTAVKVHFISEPLCEWLTSNFGRYAYGKTMPAWVFGMNHSFRKALLNGLLDSDGYKMRNGEKRIFTTSKKLAESVRLLGEAEGYSTTVYYNEVKPYTVIEGRTAHQRTSYTVALSHSKVRTHLHNDKHSWYLVKSLKKTNSTKLVHNLTVEEDNSYVADGIVVHNCQDLSMAGKRAGIYEGSRSNLFFEAIRIITEMRNATHGKQPRYAVWENVYGAFSSNGGDDFRAVLESFAKIAAGGAEVSVPRPAKGKWLGAGEIMADTYSIAWRLFDAQYWGVPQRRRRIYLVADFNGQSAPEILFKPESLHGNTEPRKGEGQGVAGYAADCAGAAGKSRGGGMNVYDKTGHRSEGRYTDITGRPMPTIQASQGMEPLIVTHDATDEDSDDVSTVYDKTGFRRDGRYQEVTGVMPTIQTLHWFQPLVVSHGAAKEDVAGFIPDQSASMEDAKIGYQEEVSPRLRTCPHIPAVMYKEVPK